MHELRFLLVEDSTIDAWMVERGFKDVPNVRLNRVTDGQEAIDYLEGRGIYGDREQYPLPHMIILDLKMPRVSGLEFLQWLRAQGPEGLRNVPVIALSGSDLPQDVNRAYALGANRFMAKTSDVNLFTKRLHKMAASWRDSELPHRRRDMNANRM